VRDIPTFFINNQKVEGEPSFKNLSKAIETALAAGKLATTSKTKRA